MDQGFWTELAQADPQSVCRRSGATRDRGGYRLRVLDGEYIADPGQRRILCSGVRPDDAPGPQTAVPALELIIVHYLLRARDLPLAGEWVGLPELGGANRFFVSHAPNFGPLLPLFEGAPAAVVRAAQGLGGRQLEYGDLAVALPMLPRVPIAFVYWRASDEFPASASVLFDRAAEQHLPLDVISAVVQEALSRLAEAASSDTGR